MVWLKASFLRHLWDGPREVGTPGQGGGGEAETFSTIVTKPLTVSRRVGPVSSRPKAAAGCGWIVHLDDERMLF